MRLEIPLKHHVLFKRIVKHKSVFVSVLGDVTHAVNIAISDALFGDIFSQQDDFPFVNRFKTGECIYKLRLPVSVDTCHTNDFSCVNFKRNVFDRCFFVNFVTHAQIFNFQNSLFGLRRLFVNLEFYRMSDHHCRQFFLGCICNVDCSDILAFTQDRAAICNRHNLVEFVRDEKD